MLPRLPSNTEYRKEKESIVETFIKKDDPTQYYDILNRVGKGAYGEVFLCRRKKDLLHCAIKKIKRRFVNEDELCLMKNCNGGRGILELIDAYDFNNNIYLVVELMYDSLERYIRNDSNFEKYSENSVRYVLIKS